MKKSLFGAATLVAALAIGTAGIAPATAVEATTTVTVKATTSAGKPLAGATITIVPSDGYSGTQQTASSAGVATFTNVDPVSYLARVDASASTLTTYSGNTVREVDARWFPVAEGASVTQSVVVKAGATLKGKVVDAKGKPVAGVNVGADNLTRYSWVGDVTDAKGAYTLTGLASGKVEVLVSKEAGGVLRAARKVVTAKQGTTRSVATVKLVAAGTAKITGKVKLTGSTGYPQSVSLLNSKKVQIGQVTPTKSGKVTFAGLKKGTYTVVVTGTNVAKKVTVKSGRTTSVGTLKRGKPATIKGVVRTAGKKVAADVTVLLLDSFGTIAGQGYTDAKGRYSIKGLTSGKYTVVAYPFGTKDAAVTVKLTAKAGKNVAKNLVLTKGATLSGYVKHGSKGVEGITVYAGNAAAETDAHGRYVLRGVAPGATVVSVTDPYVGGYHNASKKITVKKGSTLKVATITVK